MTPINVYIYPRYVVSAIDLSTSIHLTIHQFILIIIIPIIWFVTLSVFQSVHLSICSYIYLYLDIFDRMSKQKKCYEDKNHLCLCSNQIVKSVFNLSKLHVRSELKVSLYTLWLFLYDQITAQLLMKTFGYHEFDALITELFKKIILFL